MVLLFAVGCGPAGSVSETLNPVPFDATTVSASAALQAASSFADERGGGVFIDLAGQAVRVRIDGSRGQLEPHPGNPVALGPATGAFPLGPFSAIVTTSKGLFVAESGWLIAPPWRELLSPDGLVATALDANGVGWLAHDTGLFRLEDGALSELKSGSASLTGITALAVAPGADNGAAVWFAQGETLSYAERTSRDAFVIKDSGLLAADIKGGITALAGLSASPTSPGELWAITQRTLWRFFNGRWQRYEIGLAPRELRSAGRILWLRAGDSLFRYDADAQAWSEAKGLGAAPTLLAADASGAVWVRSGDQTLAVSPGVVPRLSGLFQNERLYTIEAPVVAQLPASASLSGVFFKIDDGVEKEVKLEAALPGEGELVAQRSFSMAGFDVLGAAKPVSFAALADGLHSITATATFTGAPNAVRVLHFEVKSGATGPVGFAADIKPIYTARCAKCHDAGPGRDLSNYDLWKTNADLIVTAVKDQRMPADSPLDPTFIQKIARWANGGKLP